VIIDNVYKSGDTLVLDANTCVTFVYRRCEAFFCSLCTTLQTTTDFIANQLDTAEIVSVSSKYPRPAPSLTRFFFFKKNPALHSGWQGWNNHWHGLAAMGCGTSLSWRQPPNL